MYHKTVNKHDYQALLIALHNRLNELGLTSIKYLRLSIEHTDSSSIVYQGLTRAKQINQPLMIKWQLTAKNINSNQIKTEIKALKKTASAQVILLLWHNEDDIEINNRCWRLILFSMPYIQNGDVKSYLKKQEPSSSVVSFDARLQFILAMAQSLQSLHQIGWIHGDIKPSNFLITSLEQVVEKDNSKLDKIKVSTVLCDLSLAVQIKNNSVISNNTVKEIALKTQGTPAYLAPECWQGQPVSVQSDIYAFGVSVYETLLGEKPFRVKGNLNKDTDIAIAQAWTKAHCQSPIPTLPEYLLAYQTIIHKLLTKRLETRYQDMQTVIEDLRQLQTNL